MEKLDQFDPNRTPYFRPAPGFRHTQSIHGKITINDGTGVVQPIENGPGFPIEIPTELVEINQPHVYTCSEEKKDSGGMLLNRGCPAWNGCAIVQWFKDSKYRKPTNVIVGRRGQVDSVPCFAFYSGTHPVTGRVTSQVHMQQDGWSILADRTTIPQKMKVDGKWQEIETEVPNLAPFYDQVKAQKAEAKPKRKGRPRKEAAIAS